MFAKLFEIWPKLPSWIKWPLIIIVAPNLIILMILFFTLFVPWLDNRILATITPIREMRDIQIQNMITLQEVHNKNVLNSLQRIEQHQGVLYQALLDRSGRNSNLTTSDGGR